MPKIFESLKVLFHMLPYDILYNNHMLVSFIMNVFHNLIGE